MSPKLLIWISVMLSGIAQIFLKQGMNQVHRSRRSARESSLALIAAAAREAYVWLWGLTFVAATGLWLLGLQHVDLSYAYPLVSFGYVVVCLLAAAFLRERMSANRWAAVLLICLGVMLISGS